MSTKKAFTRRSVGDKPSKEDNGKNSLKGAKPGTAARRSIGKIAAFTAAAGKSPQKANERNLPELCDNFDDMNLGEELLGGLYNYGFERPTSVQQRTILACSEGFDMIVSAQSGTGKTAAYSIGILKQLNSDLKACQSLILVPTRELALKTQHMIMGLGEALDIEAHSCVSGVKVSDDAGALNRGCQVVIGTPGRINFMLAHKLLSTQHIKSFIVDNVEEMFAQGFKDSIHTVYKSLDKEAVQVMVFGNEITPELVEFGRAFGSEPTIIKDASEGLCFEVKRNICVGAGAGASASGPSSAEAVAAGGAGIQIVAGNKEARNAERKLIKQPRSSLQKQKYQAELAATVEGKKDRIAQDGAKKNLKD